MSMEILGVEMGSDIPEGAVVTAVIVVAEVIDSATSDSQLYLSASKGLTSWAAAALLMAGFDQARRDVADGWEPDDAQP